ncbi:hypothetical protein T439DRAFT_324779 [Meredithblackwellia eburnea MCA 4105]
MPLVSPETLEAFQSVSVRPKWALIFCLWLIAPRTEPHTPSAPSITSTIPVTPSVVIAPAVPGGTNSFGNLEPPAESPLTPPFRLPKSADTSARRRDADDDILTTVTTSVMPVKGSTSQDCNSSNLFTPPPLSPPPPKQSSSSSPLTAEHRLSEEKEPDHSGLAGTSVRGRSEEDQGHPRLLERADGSVVELDSAIVAKASPALSSDSDSNTLTSTFSSMSPVDEEDCPLDYRGRPLCPDSTRVPQSLRQRSSELADASAEFGEWVVESAQTLYLSLLGVRLNPWMLFTVILHILLAIELASLVLEDAIVRVGLSNPLPPEFPRAKSLSKRLSRAKWRFKAALSRYWTHLVGLVCLATFIALLGLAVKRTPSTHGWRSIPFKWALPPLDLPTENRKRGGKAPWRHLILLEVLSAILSLLHPLKHIIPSYILPSTICVPSFDPEQTTPPASPFLRESNSSRRSSPSSPPKIELETIWVISSLVEGAASCITIAQCVILVFFLPSYSPLSLPPHVIFHILRGRFAHISSLRSCASRTVECLKTVFAEFPEEPGGDAESSQSTAWKGEEEEEETWVCTICFEGVSESLSTSESGGKSVKARCKLPCGHRYHAGCLVHWFHFQSWCPICHQTPVASSRLAAPPPVVDESDVYPGNARRRRRHHTLEVE